MVPASYVSYISSIHSSFFLESGAPMLFRVRQTLLVTAAMLAVTSLEATPSTTAATTAAPRPNATSIAGSASGGALLQVLNTSSTGGAIIGEIGPSQIAAARGAGLYGIFNPTSGAGEGILGFATNGSGIVAETFGGVYAALYAQNYSSAAAPAIQAVTNGNSVVGTSNATNSIVGITDVDTSSSMVTAAGIFGEDNTDAFGFNDGVLGSTSNGDYGVEGDANNGAFGGVAGFSATGIGVTGVTETTATPEPTDPPYEFAGVAGDSATGPGVYGEDDDTTDAPVGYFNYGRAGVYGNANTGPGVQAYSVQDIGAYVENDSTYSTLFVQADDVDTGSVIEANVGGSSGATILNLDAQGNLTVAGSVTNNGTFAKSRNPGSDRLLYSAKQAESTVEDFGSAQLVDGSASVALAADFRGTMDAASPYMVFLTPYGDNRGLFVASRTAAGFVVKEAQGGRSTLSFDYRIVGRPYGAREARLPHMASVRSAAAFSKPPLARGSGALPLNVRMASLASAPTRHGRIFATLNHRHFAANHIPAGPPPTAEVLSRQFRLR